MVQTTAPPGNYGKMGCAIRRNTLSGLPQQNICIKLTKQLDTCMSHDCQEGGRLFRHVGLLLRGTTAAD